MNNSKTYIIKLLFAFIFFSVKTEAQCLESIKKQNVFFILFEDKNKLTGYYCGSYKKNNYCQYNFLRENKKTFEYSFIYEKYRHIDDYNNDMNKSMLFRIHKSFLRKNKDIIITREFMEKMGDQKMISLLDDDASNKTIFLINTADTKNGKILLREVEIDYMKGE